MIKKFLTKKRIILGASILVVAMLAAGGIYAAQTWDKIANNPMSLFEQTVSTAITTDELVTEEPMTEEPEITASATETLEITPVPTPTPTLSPYDLLVSQADQSIMKDTLNVLLIGVDYAQERVNNPKHYVGKFFNSDVMLLLAINFKNNKVDMISFPRDSYAKIANIEGIYKLNFALQAGGGMKDKGFMNVCKSVQGILGGIPVNYYIAVTMPVVKELTNAIGGVDFNVDVSFKIDGRSYKKGMQHMDGQAVLDYCRIRKGVLSANPGDLNRVNRQKKILMAVFKKLQSTSSILEVPKIFSSMKDKVFTNMNLAQLASLTVFGKDLPEKNITMRTMQGPYVNVFYRGYVLIDQAKRVKLIKDVFGVTAKQQYKYSSSGARLLWAYMQGEAWLKAINSILAKDAKLADEQKKLIDAELNTKLAESLTATRGLLNKYKKKAGSTSYVKVSEYQELDKQVQALKALASSMFTKAGYKVDWKVPIYKKGQMVMKE